MGILVNEFASRLIRQPYFSRISNHFCLGTGAALQLLVCLQEVPISLAALMFRRMSPAFKAEHAQLTLEHPLGSSSDSEPEDGDASLLKVG